MKKLGLKKVGQIPAKADPDKQQEWLAHTFSAVLQQVRAGKAQLLFMDSAHFVMGVFLCCVWSFSRIFIQSSSARKRLNVLGVVNALSKEVTFMTNTTYITAQTVVSFLYQLREKHPRLLLYIVLNNARYQHCQLVKQAAENLHIPLLFLPAYSPNLNLIERPPGAPSGSGSKDPACMLASMKIWTVSLPPFNKPCSKQIPATSKSLNHCLPLIFSDSTNR